jgi:hypothetical protein
MKKLVILVLSGLLVALPQATANADTPPSIVVIDSGLSDAIFGQSIVTEACFLEYSNCPNGKPTMEGAYESKGEGDRNPA